MPKPQPIEPSRNAPETHGTGEPFDLRFVLLALVARYLDTDPDSRFVVLRDLEDTLASYWDGPYRAFRNEFSALPEMKQMRQMREWYRELRWLMARAGFDGERDVRIKEAA